MKRLEVVYADAAKEDLAGIQSYIHEASQSLRIAERYVDRIIIRCRKIGDLLFGGRRRDDLLPG